MIHTSLAGLEDALYMLCVVYLLTLRPRFLKRQTVRYQLPPALTLHLAYQVARARSGSNQLYHANPLMRADGDRRLLSRLVDYPPKARTFVSSAYSSNLSKKIGGPDMCATRV